MATEIAKAYVQIIPTTKGIKANLEKSLSGEADSAGKSSGNAFLGSMGSTIKTGAKVLGAAAGGAVLAMAKSALDGFADYEQLVGGVETLFKDSADTVQAYAANAYMTAGMSANEYMETVTSFSASLLQSLDGDTSKAAASADMAISDMADNANKMGSSMESIQNAYQGFAKQNYTMLDNLKLGYGGTKSEMERLLADATKISGIKYDISSLDDVYQAIHVVQTELGITGTTAEEASRTISGSLSAMKSAWQNVLVGIADDNADFGALIQNLVSTIVGENGEGGVLNNILPRVEESMQGIGDLITGLAPIVVEVIGDLIDTVLPTVVESAVSMLSAFGSGLIDNIDKLVQSAIDVVLFLVNQIADNADQMLDGAITILGALVKGIIDNLPAIIGAAAKLINALVDGIIKYTPQLLRQVPVLITNVVGAFQTAMPDIVEVGKNIVSGIWSGITAAGDWLKEKVSGFFGGIVDSAKSALGIHSPSKVFAEIGGFMAEGIGVGFGDEIGDVQRDIAGGLNGVTANVAVSADTVNAGVSSGISGYGTHEYYDVSANQSAMQPIIVQIGNETIANLVVDIMRKEVRLA